ncbi:MAG: hypothetical protein DMF66_14075 [Acidobacteria bacterium]|nr:MAG: hypothetical protein DMF66_14075 [Acidobacteriota bacterium]
MFLVLLRGDHDLQVTKLMDSVGALSARPAHPEEIQDLLSASAGSLGAVGARQKAQANNRELFIVADLALKGRRNMVTGANKDGYHLRGVDVERDIVKPNMNTPHQVFKWDDFRVVSPHEACPNCETGVLDIFKAMEIGHIFKPARSIPTRWARPCSTPKARKFPSSWAATASASSAYCRRPSSRITTRTASSGRRQSRPSTWSSPSRTSGRRS